jgi:hypothetical protein
MYCRVFPFTFRFSAALLLSVRNELYSSSDTILFSQEQSGESCQVVLLGA